MTRFFVRLAAAAALALPACAGLLLQPAANQPHATLQVQHVVSSIEGDSYDTRLYVDGNLYDTHSYSPDQIDGEPVNVRLQLAEQTVTVTASTYERATGPRTSTEERREEYTCHREECDGASPPVCHVVEDTCVRTYTVPTVEPGSAASRSEECTASVRIAPDVQHHYFVTFEYRGEGDCSATCYEHVEQADGNYQRTPCPTAY